MPRLGHRADGLADLIPYEDKLKGISHATKCSEGVAGLISNEEKLKENSFNIMVRGRGGFDP